MYLLPLEIVGKQLVAQQVVHTTGPVLSKENLLWHSGSLRHLAELSVMFANSTPS